MTSGSRRRRSPCRARASSSPTPDTTASSSSPATRRPSYAGSARVSAVWSTAALRRSTSPTACACCPTRWPPRSGTTSWSPTRSTTPCAASGSPTDTSGRCGQRETAHAGGRVRCALQPLGRDLVARPGLGRDGGRAPALDLRPAHRCRRGGRRYGQRGVARRPAARSVVRSALRPRGRRDRLWIADSETSACADVEATGRAHRRRHRACSTSATGTAPPKALLQHPLGVTALPDGSVAVSDTYNGALRRYDPVTVEVTTLATGLGEPTARCSSATTSSSWSRPRTGSPGCRCPRWRYAPRPRAPHPAARTEVAGGDARARRGLQPPPGQKLDARFGPPRSCWSPPTPPELLRDGRGPRHRPVP